MVTNIQHLVKCTMDAP